MGSWKANMVNYDLFDNQGIPPLIISIAGGTLSEDAFVDLVNMFRRARGAQNFSRILLLEAQSDGTSLEGRDPAPRLDVKSLAEYRKEDAMFLNYLNNANNEIQKYGFRLPGMFLGVSDDANYATAFIVRSTTEEQVFQPERARFDAVINSTIVKDLLGGDTPFVYRSKGPALKSTQEIGQMLALLANSGVFTVNGLISFVNEHYGLNIALYEESETWANEPVPRGLAALNGCGTADFPVGASRDEQEDDAPSEDGEDVQKNEKMYAALHHISDAVSRIGRACCGCR